MPERSPSDKTKRSQQRKKNPVAVAFGKLGASKGGIARAKKLSPERRKEIARKAIAVRWAEHRDEKPS